MTPLSIFSAAQGRVTWPIYDGLLRSGVPSRHLLFDGDFAFGVDEVAIQNGKWERRFQGDEAILLPVHTPSGAIADVVAFRPETPKSYWPMTGAQPLLGADSLERAAYARSPLMVHECPLDWMRAGYEGVVILDWKAYWPLWFEGIPFLRTMDAAFGRRLQALLRRPFEVPDVQVAA